MPDPIFDQPTDATPSSSEVTTELHAITAEFVAEMEARMQAIAAESTAGLARLGDELQTSLAESEANRKALLAKLQSIKIEEPPRQFDIVSDLNLTPSSSSLSAGLEVVRQETNTLSERARALQQNSLLYMTAGDGSLQPVKPNFWEELYRLRQAINDAPPAAITLETPKGPSR